MENTICSLKNESTESLMLAAILAEDSLKQRPSRTEKAAGVLMRMFLSVLYNQPQRRRLLNRATENSDAINCRYDTL